ncbi:hypothetical protein BABINDRAFT_172224 [Babjeviella inositovora NRRL Y-12698]|uniref:Alternative oxidase n=1 Tax=Babjeviella inositovora NRRL Y-12698 TaxID=984486 RepID=A0A1E3QLD3_9ASCO|nr:uncharacterized protein BABINDRAFT_172224 [Babjeviella inositovora NRRL Y-12698]ODQ78428.1 hypothetical protein BABINDRAFT_172224 [Babjeviella inositovora NRRL Y-12698]
MHYQSDITGYTSAVDPKYDAKFYTQPQFDHPPFTQEQCEAIHPEHRTPVTFGDKLADAGIRFVRGSFDFVTGYKKPKCAQDVEDGFKGTRYEMTPLKWLTRVIFLESIAGVPGMVAAFIRHLHSLRLLRRDHAWIETLLDEAYNERMHLLTFMKLGKPGWFTSMIIYVGQGVFCNAFFLMYLMAPKYCHRFVGYLEEEAVSTYTHLIEHLEMGKLPELEAMQVPDIAINYWSGLDKNSSMRDLVLRVRADEAKHREVNHTLANLEQKSDRNPFALEIDEIKKPQPSKGLKTHKGTGWDRKDLIL